MRPAYQTPANLLAESHASALFRPPPGITAPLFPAALRQVYKVVSVIPVSRDSSATDRFCGGIICFSTDAL